MHLSSETPTTPTPEKHGAYVGVIGDWTFLCAPWGGGLGQFRQLSSLMSNTERRLGSTKCTRDSKWLISKAQRSIRHQSIFKIYLSLVFDATSSVFTFDIIK